MATAYLNIGSNTGDRRALIARAVARIERLGGVADVRQSQPVESPAWGYESARPYLNVGVMATVTLEPMQLLRELQAIERDISPMPHRNPDGSYRDREIDIDIVAIDDMVTDTAELTLPHRHMEERDFVLRPMAELAPEWRHPRTGLTVADMLAALSGPTPSPHNTMIELRNIVKRYDKLTVLKGIDLDISRGEVVSIVGPSGAGKTTLLQIMGTLDRPDEGTVAYDGENVMKLREARLARFRNSNIGFVFQFHQLLPEFNVLENVAMPALIGGKSRKEAFDKADSLIEYMGLADRATHRPAQLSGGERQRAAVARALVNDPAVVLADEPSGSLDSQNRAELHRLFFDLRRDMGHTFVIVTHDESLAADTDRIIHMRDGLITDIESRL